MKIHIHFLGDRVLTRYWLAGALSAAATAATLVVVPGSAQATTLKWESCEENPPTPPPYEVECAWLRVPVDWATGRGAIDLRLARRLAPAHTRMGTLVYLPGGPGDSGVDQLRGRNRLSPEAAKRFDVISLDPRGTNASNPVECDPALIGSPPDVNPDTGATLAQVRDYGRRLAESCRTATKGDVFGHLDSRHVARDVEAIRAALGEDRITIYSRSYGTLAAQTYAELYPHRVRAMVLDSVFDHSLTGKRLLETSANAVEDSFTAFTTWCATAAECVLHGKNAAAIFDDLYRRAERGMLTEPSDPTRRITPTDLSWATMRQYLYGPDWPGLADRLARLAGLLPPGAASPAPRPTTKFPAAIFCADEAFTFRSEHDWKAQWSRLKRTAPHMRSHMAWQLASLCAGWPFPTTNPPRDPAVGIPALLVNSRHDPATGLRWAQNVNRMIPRSVLLTYDGPGHGVYLKTMCTQEKTDAYFIGLALPPPGTTCPAA